jgi:type I restriction enzyme S subunit
MMIKLKKYSTYKNSGVEWLGDIPEGWEVKKLKYISKIKTGYTPNTNKINNYIKNGMVWVKPDNLNEFTLIFDSKEKISSKGIKNQNIIPKGSLLVNCIGTIGKFGIAGVDLITNQQINAVIFNKSIESEFGKYLIFASNSEHNKYSNGNVMQILNTTAQGIIKLPIPPKQEQIKIASFLDDKTQQLDKAVKQKEQLIKLLKERRQILINNAVTKGIDKTVSMKNSGFEWIGDIPEHWEIRRLASIGSFSKGGGIARDNLISDGMPAILYGDIYTKYNYKTDVTENFISKDIAKNAIKIIKGKILLTGSGETKEDIGKCIVYTGEVDAYIGGDVVIFNQNKESSLFLGYSLNSSNSVSQKMMMAKGEIIVHIYGSKLKELIIPLPLTKKEQEKIVNYIEKNNQKIDKTIDLQQQQITKLKEYKITLIDNVVTGKVRVV